MMVSLVADGREFIRRFAATKDKDRPWLFEWVREYAGELIAIVDDEERVRVALRRLCSAWDLEPRIFASARELFDSLPASHPDCLIVDVHMPGLGGLDALAWLLERGISIPSIVITGRDDEDMRVRAAAVGASAYLCKPIDAGVLLDAINRALASRSSPRPNGVATAATAP